MSSLISTLRKPKILDMAIFDWVATIIAAYLIWVWMKKRYSHTRSKRFLGIIFVTLVLLGIILHVVTRTPTKFNYYLGLGEDPRTEFYV